MAALNYLLGVSLCGVTVLFCEDGREKIGRHQGKMGGKNREDTRKKTTTTTHPSCKKYKTKKQENTRKKLIIIN